VTGEPPIGDSPELETRERQSLLALLVLMVILMV